MTYEPSTAPAFAALADPTRRAIVERLRAGPVPVGAIAAGLPVSRPAVSQHLKVLAAAGIVEGHAAGTRHLYALRREGLAEARAWLDALWTDALQAYADHAAREEDSR